MNSKFSVGHYNPKRDTVDWYSQENQDNIELRGLEADRADENLPAEDNEPIQ